MSSVSPVPFIFSNSPFERLPLELLSGILEHAPECALKLRASSQAMRWRVAEYAMNDATARVVRDLRFYHVAKLMEVDVTVRRATKLFELRLIENPILFSQARRASIKGKGTKVYRIHFTRENERSVLEYFSDCIGRSFEKVEIIDYNKIIFYSTITKLLDSKEFGNLEIKFETLSYLAFTQLLRPLKDCTDQISLSVGNVMAYYPERFLLELSTFFRAIRIKQLCIPGLKEFRAFFFGREDFNWSPTILGMFSRKMDTLYISNFHYPEYLSEENAATLLKKLTQNQKKLWFMQPCGVK